MKNYEQRLAEEIKRRTTNIRKQRRVRVIDDRFTIQPMPRIMSAQDLQQEVIRSEERPAPQQEKKGAVKLNDAVRRIQNFGQRIGNNQQNAIKSLFTGKKQQEGK